MQLAHSLQRRVLLSLLGLPVCFQYKAIMQSSHFAQERLALEAGVDRTVVSKIDLGVTNPSLEILLRLANHLKVEVGQLLLSPDE